jgi:hypothetical protein
VCAHLRVIDHLPDVGLDACPVRARVQVLASVLFLFGDPTSRLFRALLEPVVRIGDVHGASGLAFVDIDVIRTARLGVAVRDPSVGSHCGQGEPSKRTWWGSERGARESNSGLSK